MIRISSSDASFMLHTLEMSERLRGILAPLAEQGGTISDDDADGLRDLCADRLQTHGFDENYQPNQVGQKLEALIDKLFVG